MVMTGILGGRSTQLDVAYRNPLVENTAIRPLELRPQRRHDLGDGVTEVFQHRSTAVDGGDLLVDAHVAELAIDEEEADRSARLKGVEDRQRLNRLGLSQTASTHNSSVTRSDHSSG